MTQYSLIYFRVGVGVSSKFFYSMDIQHYGYECWKRRKSSDLLDHGKYCHRICVFQIQLLCCLESFMCELRINQDDII